MPEQADMTRRTSRNFRIIRWGVPIFNYHGLIESVSNDVPAAAQEFWLSPAKFRSHLAHIQENGFRAISLSELNDQAPESRAVVLTFDDGLLTDYDAAFPLLVEFGMKATFFLNSSTVGHPGYLDWAKIAAMQRRGMSFQSHGCRHVDLTLLPTSALDAELAQSKQHLEDRLGTQVEFLAVPFGVLDRRVVGQALAAGYRAVCSTRCLPARPGSPVLTRITLHRQISLGEFDSFMTGEVWPYARTLLRGLLLRPRNVASHLYGVLLHRLLKQSTVASQ